MLYGGVITCLPGQPSHPAVSERGERGSRLPQGDSPQQVSSCSHYTEYTYPTHRNILGIFIFPFHLALLSLCQFVSLQSDLKMVLDALHLTLLLSLFSSISFPLFPYPTISLHLPRHQFPPTPTRQPNVGIPVWQRAQSSSTSSSTLSTENQKPPPQPVLNGLENGSSSDELTLPGRSEESPQD